jgi:hypothetical protein
MSEFEDVNAAMVEIEELAEKWDEIDWQTLRDIAVKHRLIFHDSDSNHKEEVHNILKDHFNSSVEQRKTRFYISPAEIYALPGKPYELAWLNNWGENYVYDLMLVGNLDELALAATDIVVKQHYYHNFDGRRYMLLASLWFRGAPVMLIWEAGREGRDYNSRTLTDTQAYKEMLTYLYQLYIETQEIEVLHQADKDKKSHDYLEFYGNRINPQDLF